MFILLKSQTSAIKFVFSFIPNIITVHRDDVMKPTNTFVLTFNSSNLPTVVKIGFIQVKVDVYIPNPL